VVREGEIVTEREMEAAPNSGVLSPETNPVGEIRFL
jgi:hypothetical protein